METIRLLGGSWHGRKIETRRPLNDIYLTKKPTKKKWSPILLNVDPDALFVIEQEVYERKNMRNCVSSTGYRRTYETRTAFVKKGAKIKDTTFWKLGLVSGVDIIEHGKLIVGV